MDDFPPLIPNEREPPFADVSPVLREAFQSLFAIETCNRDDKKCVNKPGSLSRDHITNAEQNVMRKHADYLVCKSILDKNGDLMEHMTLRQPSLVGSPKEEYRETYHLLKADDLKGKAHERYFSIVPLDIPAIERPCKHLGADGDKLQKPKSYMQEPCQAFIGKSYKPKIAHESGDVFEVTPTMVVFHNYEPRVKYVKILKLRNRTSRGVHFAVRPLGLGQFQVHLEKVVSVAPPGMPVKVRIQFIGCDRIGVRTKLHIFIENSPDLDIDIIAYRDPPILKGIVLDLEYDLHKTISSISIIPRQSDREKVLNRSIECGACLLGDFKEVLLLVRNIGGAGKFFIVSEEDWYSSTVNDVTTDGFLVSPPFCMSPVYFSIKPGGVAALQTIFSPRICGAHVERVLLICDNCTIRGADLLGDGVLFDPNCISIDVSSKDYDILMDGDNDAIYHIDFGERPLNSSNEYEFTITNIGPVELSFYWVTYEPAILWTAANPGIQNLPLPNISVCPINGIIESNEVITLKMIANVKCYGDFRVSAALYVADIPLESICDPIPESHIERNSDCDIDKVDVLLSSVEVWIKCCPADVQIEPCDIDLTCGNITGSEIDIPVEVHNKSEFETGIEIEYCGHLKKDGKLEKSAQVSKITKKKPRLGISNETKKIPAKLKHIYNKKPCATIPGKKCTVKCPTRKICKRYAKSNAIYKEPEMKEPLKSCTIHGTTLHENKEASIADRREGSPTCVAPKNTLGCDKSVASITPIEAVMEPLSTLQLNVNLKLDGCQKTQERFVFLSTDEFSPVHKLDVKVRSYKHCLEVSKSTIDFGVIKRGIKISDELTITKNCFAPICWVLKEYSYNFMEMKFVIHSNKNTSIYKGSLTKDSNSVEIKYNLIAKVFGPVLSILEIKCWKRQKDICEFYYVIVKAVVSPPLLSISTSASGTPTLAPNGPLFYKIPSTHQILLTNYGKVPISFMWSTPIGKQAYSFKIKFTPKAAIIPVNESKIVDVDLIPHEVGLIDKFFVPCFIGRQIDPILLGVMCVVENVFVTFSIPTEFANGEPTLSTIIWSRPESKYPKPLPDEIKSEIKTGDDSKMSAGIAMADGQEAVENLAPEIEVRTHDFDDDYETESYYSITDNDQNIDQNYPISDKLFKKFQDSMWQYLYVEGLLTSKATLSGPTAERTSFSEFLNMQDDSIDSLHEVSNPVLNSLSSSAIIQSIASAETVKLVLLKEFNLQTKVPIKKTIFIRNETPIRSKFKVTVQNYKVATLDLKTTIESLIAKVYGDSYDEWAHQVPLGQGLIIHPQDVEETDLLENTCYNIDLWIYADTWGCYHDIVTIQVKGLQPFDIPVMVVATGYPIQIPISNKKAPPVLDFGSYSKESGTITRRFLVKNICGIQLKISWHIFMEIKAHENELSDKDIFPFNVLVDVHQLPRSSREKSDFNPDIQNRSLDVLLTEYYGKEIYNEFQIIPAVSDIMPRNEEWITITFTPKYLRNEYHKNIDLQDVECAIVGFIRIHDVDKIKKPRMLRLDGSIFKPVFLIGKAQNEKKCISIEFLGSDCSTPVSATDILGCCTRSLKFSQKLLFKNKGTDVKLNINTEDPYQIVSLSTRHMCTQDKTRDVDVFLHHLDILEIELEALLELRHVWVAWDIFQKHPFAQIYNLLQKDVKKSAMLQREFTVSAGNHMKQILKMEIEMFFPDLRLCSKEYVLFGPVFVGDSATDSIILCNKSGCKINFQVQLKYSGDEIELLTKSGTVFPAIRDNYYSALIHVKFAPKGCRKYSNIIQILTCLPFYNFQIYVTGYGTNDSKYRILETIIS